MEGERCKRTCVHGGAGMVGSMSKETCLTLLTTPRAADVLDEIP